MNYYSENCTHITTEEIHSALTQLDENKTSGSDKYALAYEKTTKSRIAFRFFSRNVSIATLYPRHGYIVQSPQFSSNQEADIITINYRGITVQSCVAKAFCKILNNRIDKYLQANNILHDERNGFHKNIVAKTTSHHYIFY